MPAKRKREAGTPSTPHKKKRASAKAPEAPPSQSKHLHGDIDDTKFYKIRAIIDEKNGQYYIDWEDDSDTGRSYPPTWEKKSNANALAVADWNKRKAAKATTAQNKPLAQPAITPSRGRGRPRKRVVIESSSPVPSPEPDNGTSEVDLDLEIGESQQSPVESRAIHPPQRQTREPTVQVPDPPSSYDRGSYQKIRPELSSTSGFVNSSAAVNSSANISEPLASIREEVDVASEQQDIDTTPRIVPDSQSQGQTLEESTFRGFSPTQTQTRKAASQFESNAEEGAEQPSDSDLEAAQTQPQQTASELEDKAEEFAEQESDSGFGAHRPIVATALRHSFHDSDNNQALGGAEEVGPSEEAEDERFQSVVASGASASFRALGPRESGVPPAEESTQLDLQSQKPFQPTVILQPSRVAAPVSDEQHPYSGPAHPPSTAARLSVPEGSQEPEPEPEEQPSTGEQISVLKYPVPEPQSSLADSLAAKGQSDHSQLDPREQRLSPIHSPHSQLVHQVDQVDTQKSPAAVSVDQTDRTEPARGAVEDYIVISEENTSSSVLDLLTQPDYNHPPAGQPPPPSSFWSEHLPAASRSKIEIDTPSHRTTLESSQSSFPFETQLSIPANFDHGSQLQTTIDPRPDSSALLSSSQIPSVPSQPIRAVGESAPARLATPSTVSTGATMEPSKSDQPKSLLDKLNEIDFGRSGREARMAARRSRTPKTSPEAAVVSAPASAIPANISAEVAQAARHANGARSPSTVPALEPEPVITREEMRTSGRFPTLVPHANGADYEDHAAVTVTKANRSDEIEMAGVFVVPVAFAKQQRDQYNIMVEWHQEEIRQFLDGQDRPEQFIQAKSTLEELRKVTMHPDLISMEASSQPTPTPEQAEWDLITSGKFRFLRDLLEQIRGQDKDSHIVVAAKGHEATGMLETFLRGLEMPHRMLIPEPTTQSQAQTTEQATGLMVSILDLDLDLDFDSNIAIEHRPTDVVIAMDGTCSHEHPLIRAARLMHNGWAKLLVLVVPYSIEHIEKSLLSSITEATRARTLLKTASKLRGAAGRLTPSQASSVEAALEISSFLASSGSTWPIEELGTIENLDSQTETDIDHTREESSFSTGKRSLDMDAETLTGGESGKRPRVSSVEVDSQVPGTVNNQEATIDPRRTTINPHDVDIDITHISDSLGKRTQPANEAASSDIVEQLRQLLLDKHDQLQEHVKAMSDLQFRFEDQHVKLANTKKERDEAIATAQTAVLRTQAVANQNVDLRTERGELKQALEDANVKLTSHAIPERREFEVLRLALETEKLEKAKAEKQAEQARKESEYSREAYQGGTSRMRQLAQENEDLEARIAEAERLAFGEQAKARAASNDVRNDILAKENRKLKAMLRDREAALKFRDEEIARLKERGRIGTRGSSVPRSPRMGSPALKGRSSRQGSPSAGEVKGRHLHPLRNG